jgi:hypothetical protein
MYSVSLFENGVFSTQIGGEVKTLAEAIAQIEKLMAPLASDHLPGILGCGWDRNGTPCALIVTDEYGFPISDVEFEKEEE